MSKKPTVKTMTIPCTMETNLLDPDNLVVVGVVKNGRIVSKWIVRNQPYDKAMALVKAMLIEADEWLPSYDTQAGPLEWTKDIASI